MRWMPVARWGERDLLAVEVRRREQAVDEPELPFRATNTVPTTAPSSFEEMRRLAQRVRTSLMAT